jgi:hypothetical protein
VRALLDVEGSNLTTLSNRRVDEAHNKARQQNSQQNTGAGAAIVDVVARNVGRGLLKVHSLDHHAAGQASQHGKKECTVHHHFLEEGKKEVLRLEEKESRGKREKSKKGESA